MCCVGFLCFYIFILFNFLLLFKCVCIGFKEGYNEIIQVSTLILELVIFNCER